MSLVTAKIGVRSKACNIGREVDRYGVRVLARSGSEEGKKGRGTAFNEDQSLEQLEGARHTGGRKRERTSHPKEGDNAIQRGERKFDGGIIKAFRGCDRRLDLGLQDAPRSTIYSDQATRG